MDDDIPRAETLDTSEEDTDSESEIVNLEERYALMKTTSYFDILGVNEDDNSETITRAYHRELDRLSSQLAVLRPELLMMAEKFAQSLNEAHQVLIHPVLRDRYRRHQNRAGRQ